MEKLKNFNEHLDSIYTESITPEFIEDKLKKEIMKVVLQGQNLAFDSNSIETKEKLKDYVKIKMQELHDNLDEDIKKNALNFISDAKLVGKK